MFSITISNRYNRIGITTNTCKLRLFQGNSFLNIIYFFTKKLKANVALLQKQTKHTRVSVLMKI